jgi:hypothetical protein
MSESNGYIIAAYTVTWITLIGYAIRLHLVSRRARAQMESASRGHTLGGNSE